MMTKGNIEDSPHNTGHSIVTTILIQRIQFSPRLGHEHQSGKSTTLTTSSLRLGRWVQVRDLYLFQDNVMVVSIYQPITVI